MRADAVEYIRENYASFQHLILTICHVYDIRDEQKERGAENDSENFDIDKECLFFLNTLLPQNRCWTGSETLKALSNIHKVNIIVIYEMGPVHVTSNYDNQNAFDKTIILAYRTSQCGSRNHYDIVTDIEPNVIYSLAQQISKQMPIR